MPRSQHAERVAGDPDRWRHLGEQPAIRAVEQQLAVRLALDLETLFVHRAVVSTAQKGEVGQRRRPALRPVPDVMALADAHTAPGKPTTLIALLQRPP
jgi:hypothetical protein